MQNDVIIYNETQQTYYTMWSHVAQCCVPTRNWKYVSLKTSPRSTWQTIKYCHKPSELACYLMKKTVTE